MPKYRVLYSVAIDDEIVVESDNEFEAQEEAALRDAGVMHYDSVMVKSFAASSVPGWHPPTPTPTLINPNLDKSQP